MDPNPGGPKTYGSDGSGFGSATLVEGLPAHQAGPLDLLQGVQVGDLLVVDELVLLLGQLQLTHNDVTGVGQRL
jgi:hypothetical protein